MKLSHGWLQTGTESAEHMAETQLVTAGASKTWATSVNFLELAVYTCFCRIQVMNSGLFLPPSSPNSTACSQQDASPSGISCPARHACSPVRLCGDSGVAAVPAAKEPAAGKQWPCYMAVTVRHSSPWDTTLVTPWVEKCPQGLEETKVSDRHHVLASCLLQTRWAENRINMQSYIQWQNPRQTSKKSPAQGSTGPLEALGWKAWRQEYLNTISYDKNCWIYQEAVIKCPDFASNVWRYSQIKISHLIVYTCSAGEQTASWARSTDQGLAEETDSAPKPSWNN